ncbi:MAG: hypothetical protein ACREJC_14665, partial [Tepidisphaeraceae bacterium]
MREIAENARRARTRTALQTVAVAAVVGLAGQAANAVIFAEVEANDTKTAANLVAGMASADSITGTTTGASTTVAGVASADYFRVSTAAAAPGIYKHQLVLTSAVVGHTGTIRGLTQTSSTAGGVINTTSDTAMQTSSTATTPPRMVQWYGFGKSESIYYRVAGVAATTAPYTATLTDSAVSTTDAATVFTSGSITITTVGQTGTSQTDTDLWVYDSNFNAIATYGNDDEGPGGATLGSRLIRSYGPGATFYIAISNFQVSNNQASPADDDFQTGAVLDFPDAVANSSTTG